VVLNSLAGEFLRRSFELLAPGGRFVEIGKQDISKGRELPLLPFNAGLSFFALDLDRMAFEDRSYFRPLATAVVAAFEAGILSPLPTEVFPAANVEAAFRKLGSGAHIGKIAVDFSEGVGEVAPGMSPKALFRKDASYLVTGGLGGFGLRTAEWMMESGAGAVVLAGRRGELSPEDAARLEALSKRTGCKLETCRLDVTEREQVESVVARLSTGPLPLRGIFHSAMVLDDRPILETDFDSLGRVMLPKALGAQHLHLASLTAELDHFVLYSSVSAIVGNPGQAAYAAANAFLDGLALSRRRKGLPGTSVHWGALSTVGVVSRDEQVERHLKSIGIVPVDPDRALAALGELLREDRDLVGVIDIDWDRWVRSCPEAAWSRLELLLEGRGGGSVAALRAAELAKLDEGAQLSQVATWLAAAMAPIFRMPVESFNTQVSLKDYGLDSILALELQVAIESSVGVELSSMEILSGRPVRGLAELCLKRLLEAGGKEGAAELGGRSITKEVAHSLPTGDLAEYFLGRICVQRPYFALEDVKEEGEWLSARARPAPSVEGERSAVAVAEAARHLAILGSCACRLQHRASSGRVYYPVKSSVMSPVHQLTSSPRLEEISILARCVSTDEKASTARAETRLLSADGVEICSFIVDYHVIPELEFSQLFAERALPTNEGRAPDPYKEFQARKAHQFDLGARKLTLGKFDADECLGHFVGYPAYPVSIMLRDAFALVGAVVESENPGKRVRLSIVGGSTGTERFVFAGEETELALVRDEDTPAGKLFRCEVSGSGKMAAWFEMIVQLEIADAPSVSGWVSYTADEEAKLG
jgi:NAD(P)-dependent dehydrogenase (short-subunit alcohol dehydrogenase family)/acyl carrier protein